jgi:hypothetical protein
MRPATGPRAEPLTAWKRFVHMQAARTRPNGPDSARFAAGIRLALGFAVGLLLLLVPAQGAGLSSTGSHSVVAGAVDHGVRITQVLQPSSDGQVRSQPQNLDVLAAANSIETAVDASTDASGRGVAQAAGELAISPSRDPPDAV